MLRLLLCSCLVLLSLPAVAQSPSTDWAAQKCAIYRAAWDRAIDAFGSDDMNPAFIAGNETFIAGGCTARADICPQSTTELKVANALSIALINAGAASTFLPFRCPHPAAAVGGWTGPGL